MLKGVHSPYMTEIAAKYGQQYVHVQMLAAPVNPADINMIQGVYPILPDIPAIGGNEGCGLVVDIGRDVTRFSVGDFVLPRLPGWGTWKTHGIGMEDDFLFVPKDISPLHACMLTVNPCTAYRLLRDFVKLEPGDVVIQNGGNSGVGQCVIQMAKHLGLQTISIIRERPNTDELIEYLKSKGADFVVVDHSKEFASLEMKHLMSHLPKAKLGLNCVGGKGSAKLLKYMDNKSVLVTFGGMSKQPLMVPAGPLIFNDLKLAGFWMTRWSKENRDNEAYNQMWHDIFQMVRGGSLKIAKNRAVYIEDFMDAITKATTPYSTEKQILVMDKKLLK